MVTAIENLAGARLDPAGPRELLEHLLARHLLDNYPRLGHLLRLLGVLTVETVAATATRPAHSRIALPLDWVVAFVTDPLRTITAGWRWAPEPLDTDLLLLTASGSPPTAQTVGRAISTPPPGPRPSASKGTGESGISRSPRTRYCSRP
jgi:hypothetical protein